MSNCGLDNVGHLYQSILYYAPRCQLGLPVIYSFMNTAHPDKTGGMKRFEKAASCFPAGYQYQIVINVTLSSLPPLRSTETYNQRIYLNLNASLKSVLSTDPIIDPVYCQVSVRRATLKRLHALNIA